MNNYINRTILFLCFFIAVKAQENKNYITVSDTFSVKISKEFVLSRKIVIPSSIRFFSKFQLLKPSDFRHIPYKNSYILVNDNVTIDTLIISYQTIPSLFSNSFYKRKMSILETTDSIYYSSKAVSESKPILAKDIFGENINKSGSITRGFTVSTNKDMTVNSGLNLQLSGKISDDIEIVAALSDQNLPFQAEGNTERLEELDKVFVQIKHKNFTGTFGDYELLLNNGEFGQVNRKLKGLSADFNYDTFSGSVSIATSRGKFNTNQFNGVDGIQGPYRLRGKNNEREIIIIAGSEKVYLDGLQLNRGENNDYVIDYSTSEITFTPKQLITSKSRISVDFEYSDRKYSRTYFNTSLTNTFFDDKLKVSFAYTREGDDETSPIEIELSDEEKEILKKAGYNRFDAFVSGVREVEPDSLGNINGYYTKVDTLINGSNFTLFRYKPGDEAAVYNVTFSYVGEGKGDYNRISLGNYYFAGVGKGGYLPIKLLPLPELLQTGNMIIKANPYEYLTVNLEFAGSINNKNRFAENIDPLQGIARNFLVKFNPKDFNLFGYNIPELSLSVKDRFINKDFVSFDRVYSVEFNRDYSSDLINKTANELLREYNFGISPIKNLYADFLFGQLEKDDYLKTDRSKYILNYDSKKIKFNYKIDKSATKTLSLNSDWLKQDGRISYTPGVLSFGVSYLFDEKKKSAASDSLIIDSYKYYEIKPFMELINYSGFNLKTSVSYRDEFSPLDGKMIKEAESVAHNYEIDYNKIREFKTHLSLTIRNKEYSDEYKSSSNKKNESILLRSQSRVNLFNRFLDASIFYETSTQRSARYQKVFVRVTQGTGNYKYLGDLNNNGIAEENEFEPTIYDGDFIVTVIPTEEMYPIIDLKTNLRLKLDFAKLFNKNSALGKLLSPVQTETVYRIEENSRIKDISKIYLLKQSYFMNDSTTIRGANIFQQDLHIFKNKKDFSIRFRYIQRKRMFQYSTGSERGYYRERGFRIKTKLIEEFSNETEYINITDNNIAPLSSNRSRLINSNSISTEIIYKPSKEIESGLKILVGESRDDFPENPTIVNTNSQIFRFNYSFIKKGRLRLELERNELGADNGDNYIPFEIAKGNSVGINYYIRFYFDYKINSFIQTSFNYNGRKNADGDFIHSMRAEARAFF